MLIGVRISDRQAKGQIFIPMHFREAAANLLTNPKLDPYAKQASFKISAVKIERVPSPPDPLSLSGEGERTGKVPLPR